MKLSAEVKSQVGKGVNRRLRKQGRVPAILYGKHQSPIPMSLNQLEVEKVLAVGGAGKLITLDINGLNVKDNQTLVMFKEIQRNALTGKLDHMDLYSVTRGEKITIVLPIVFIGDAKEKEKGGTLQFVTREVTIQCLPRNIPESIEVDISSIEMGASIFMGDIKLPETVKLLDDPEKVVASIVTVKAEVEEPVDEEGVEEEAPEASESETDAPA